MPYNIVIYSEKRWIKDLLVLPKKDQGRVLDALEELAVEPWPAELQVKRLHDYPTADFRLRVGSYRVLLDRDEETKTVWVYRLLHRNKLY